jgi:hypothetical protein
LSEVKFVSWNSFWLNSANYDVEITFSSTLLRLNIPQKRVG